METEQYSPNSMVPATGTYYCVLCTLSVEMAKAKGADPFLIATLYVKGSGIEAKALSEIFSGCSEPIIRREFKESDKFTACPIHGTATGWALEQGKDNVKGIAETWLLYYIGGFNGSIDGSKEWVVHKLDDLSKNDPARAWEIVQFINSRNISDERTDRFIDTIVGGSPLPNIMYECSDSLWKSILTKAASDERLRRQLKEIVKDPADKANRWQELQSLLDPGKLTPIETQEGQFMSCLACHKQTPLPAPEAPWGSAVICVHCNAPLIPHNLENPLPTSPERLFNLYGLLERGLEHPRCPYCSKINYAVVFPEKGLNLAWYVVKKPKDRSSFHFQVDCARCKKGFYVEWDQNPF